MRPLRKHMEMDLREVPKAQILGECQDKVIRQIERNLKKKTYKCVFEIRRTSEEYIVLKTQLKKSSYIQEKEDMMNWTL